MTGNLKWKCPHCTVSYNIEKPGAQMTKTRCAHLIHGQKCDQRYYHGVQSHNGPTRMIVWPAPEEPVTDQDIISAARLVRDMWALDQRIHYKRLFEAVSALCKAVNAAESKT